MCGAHGARLGAGKIGLLWAGASPRRAFAVFPPFPDAGRLYLLAMSALAAVSRLLLVLVVLTSMQSYLVIETAFALNQDAIAARFCVNLDKPEMHCNGTCELTKRLEAQQQQDGEQQTTLLSVALASTMWLAAPARLGAPPARDASAHARPTHERAQSARLGDVFHPPRQA